LENLSAHNLAACDVLHGKNDFTEKFKNSARYRYEDIFVTEYIKIIM